MKRVGLYGGTFSPPHIGHRHAAEAFLAAEQPDELRILPTFTPPHKLPDGEATPADRLAMCRLAFSDLPRTVVDDREIRREGKSYTVLTLRELSAPDTRLLLLCGTDMFLTLGEWYLPEEIFRLAEIVAVRRESDPAVTEQMQQRKQEYEERFGATVRLLPNPVTEISSAQLRARLASGEELGGYLLPQVEEYIRRCKLYCN